MATEIEKILFRIEADTKQLRKGLKRAEKQVQSSTDKMIAGFRAFQGILLATGIVAFGVQVAKASLSMDRINSALKVATGSTAAANKEFAFISSEAERLGLNLEQAATEYSRLAAAAKGTKLEGKATRDIFIAVSEASAALGLSADQSRGALNALQQMISKGTVQAEELRGQLGERLPGAFQIAARAMGKTTQELGKMLELGQVTADELLPLLAKELTNTFGAQAQENSSNLRAEMERLNTAMFNLKLAVGSTGLIELLTDGTKWATKLVDALSKIKIPLAPFNPFPGLGGVAGPQVQGKPDFSPDVADPNKRLSDDGTLSLFKDFAFPKANLRESTVDPKRKKFQLDLLSQEVEMQAQLEQALVDTHDAIVLTDEAQNSFFEGLQTGVEGALSKSNETLREQAELQQKVFAIIKSGQDPTDIYLEKLKLLDEAVRTVNTDTGEGIITQEEYAKGVEASAKQWEESTKRIQSASQEVRLFGSAISTAMEDAIFSGQGLREVFAGLLQDIGRIIFRLTVTKTLEKSLSGIGGGGGLLSGIGSFLFGSAKGNVFQGGAPVAFAKGGVVNSPTTFPMSTGRMGLMGEAGAEGILPLRRGRGGKLGVESNGGGGGVTYYIDARGSNSDEGVFKIVRAAIMKASPSIINASVKKVVSSRKSNPALFKG